MKSLCWVLAGPTASGKTSFSLRLAKQYDCEIVCMDSMQIYRGMDIGTAKPTAAERAEVPHHMLDVASPSEPFSVASYQALAEACMADIQARGKQVLLVGGTGFYLRALRQPMAMGDAAADERLRAELEAVAAETGGKERLHAELEAVDAVTAARLHVNDVRRVIRALEVYRLTGKPFSQQPQIQAASRFQYRVACLSMAREVLYQRIEQRVDQMMAAGLAEEVRGLLREGVPPDAQAMKAIGYKELVPYCEGKCSQEEAVIALKLNTRHYAKRQLTWMRREPDVLWVDALAADAYKTLCAYFERGESL